MKKYKSLSYSLICLCEENFVNFKFHFFPVYSVSSFSPLFLFFFFSSSFSSSFSSRIYGKHLSNHLGKNIKNITALNIPQKVKKNQFLAQICAIRINISTIAHFQTQFSSKRSNVLHSVINY